MKVTRVLRSYSTWYVTVTLTQIFSLKVSEADT